jgi:hypothetical protein
VGGSVITWIDRHSHTAAVPCFTGYCHVFDDIAHHSRDLGRTREDMGRMTDSKWNASSAAASA